ncbi:MAG: ParB N-terminal domain-containing protein [Aestuariivita sp.]|nr:ParB N-terminal domain-containing protein [Aestuariivita sp.]MCY4345173.1 ParB N-terminal domain-containing protein [Aestuariivita sp.]
MTPDNVPSEIHGTLRIRNTDIPVVTTTVSNHCLKFFVENPRIYSILRKDHDAEPSQDEIQAKLIKMEHVKELIQDIRRDGGLTDPIIVGRGTWEVLEGNSRLAAYRRLAELDPIKWDTIKVQLLPEDVDDALVLALLGQYHIRGKTPWPPFEKAGFLYRRHKNHDVSVEQLALEVGETKNRVDQLVRVYQFMVDHDQDEKDRWSYFEEYFKSQHIKKVRDKNLDQLVVQKIATGEIQRAIDIRNKLAVICKSPKSLKKFKDGHGDFDRAYAVAVKSGADSTPYMKLSKFRRWLASTEATDALMETSGETRQKIKFELNKLNKIVPQMLKHLKTKDGEGTD